MALNFNHTGAGTIILSSDAAATLKVDGYKVWHENNDGAASGLDADLLDGQHGSYYQDASNLNAGTLADARVAQSNVTQHEAALTILESQITDGSVLARVAGNEAITGAWTFNTTLPTSSLTPSGASDLVTKSYVDALVVGLSWKDKVRAATTANITLSGTQTVDGVSLSVDDRVLVKNQSTTANNGIYLCKSGAWTRATDMDSWAEVVSAAVFVSEGTTNADVAFVCTSDAGGTLGSTAISFTQFTGTGTVYTAGSGLAESPAGTFNVGTASSARIVVNADDIDLATTAVSPNSYGSASSVATFTVDAYGRLTAAASTSIQITESQITDGTVLARVGGNETVTGAWEFNTTAPYVSVGNTRLGSGAATDTRQVLSLASGTFSTTGDASTRMYVVRRATTSATPAVLTTDGAAPGGSNTLVLPNDSTWYFKAKVVARRTDADNESAAYEFTGCIDRNATAGTTAIVGGVASSIHAEDNSTWDVAVAADATNGALEITVTGEAAKNISWVAFVEATQVVG